MKRFTVFLLSALACLTLSLAPGARGQATAVATVFTDTDSNAGLILGSDGNFYGTSYDKKVFKLSPDGTLTVLCTFPNGIAVSAALTETQDGNFYGAAYTGGANGTGALFEVTPAGNFTLLYAFNALDKSRDNVDGANPVGALVQASDGNFYGTAPSGGLNGAGTIFRITPAGVFTPLHQFNPTNPPAASDGASPYAGLILGADGNFYGTTSGGGANGTGTVFKITTDGVLTTLHTFSAVTGGSNEDPIVNDDGAHPNAGLTLGKDGNFYGTTDTGGKQGGGVAYQITPSGAFTVFDYFPTPPVAGDSLLGSNTLSPIIQAADGNFYGTLSSNGFLDFTSVFFRLTPEGVYTRLVSVSQGLGGGNQQGHFSSAAPVQGADGNFYVTGPPIFKIGFQPVITSLSYASGYANYLFLYQITATDDATTFGATGLPAGLSVDPATGLISGKATVTGDFTVTLTASNGTATGSSLLYLSITVAPPPPVLTTALNATSQVGANFTFRITATHAPTGFGADGLPPGLTVNSTTGLISGQPAAEGTYQVTLGAANVSGLGTAPLTLMVLPPPPAPALTSSLTPLSVGVGNGFGYTITATNSPASFGATGLPVGLTLNTLTGVISGKPTEPGTFDVAISATNGGGTATATLAITVTPVPAITSPGTASATLGVPFAYQITTNVPADQYYSPDPLPAGLSLDPTTGVLSGTPAATGVYAFRLIADFNGMGALLDFTLTVLDSPTTVNVATGGDGTAQAGSHNGKFLVSRTGDTRLPLTVNYKFKGSARPGIDYKELAGSVTIPAGASKAKVKIKPIPNPANPGTLVVKIKLRADAQGGFKLGAATVARVMILPPGN